MHRKLLSETKGPRRKTTRDIRMVLKYILEIRSGGCGLDWMGKSRDRRRTLVNVEMNFAV